MSLGPSPLQPPVLLLEPQLWGARNPVGQDASQWGGLGKKEAEAFILPPGAHRGPRGISVCGEVHQTQGLYQGLLSETKAKCLSWAQTLSQQ